MVDMLPQPSEPFIWVQASPGPALVCQPLAAVAPHLFTTRTWQLGSQEKTAACADGWGEVASAVGVGAAALVHVQQVHGVSVRRAADTQPIQADIVINDRPRTAAAVQAADCVPLLLADRATGAVAAIHSGWRGTARRAAAVGVGALAAAFGSRPADLVAAIGPSIGACCYEVGSDVRDAFVRGGFSPAQIARWFAPAPRPTIRNRSMASLSAVRRTEHWFFDAWQAVAEQLCEAGVPRDRIHVAELCTASHPAAFCSHRRDGAPAGRLAAAIAVPAD
jgi:hypothetical protein